MSKRVGQPRGNASNRTLRRWTNPTERTRWNTFTKEWESSANPNCTRNRNIERFDKRKLK